MTENLISTAPKNMFQSFVKSFVTLRTALWNTPRVNRDMRWQNTLLIRCQRQAKTQDPSFERQKLSPLYEDARQRRMTSLTWIPTILSSSSLPSTSGPLRKKFNLLVLTKAFTNRLTTKGRTNIGSVSALSRESAENATSGVSTSPVIAV